MTATIYTHIYHSPIGTLKIVATDTHIEELVFIEPADIPYVEIDVTESNSIIHQCIDELIAYFSGTSRSFTVPLHQEGTEFQQRVWKELYEIPFGKTMSYGELAKKLGDPKCIRAAASANGKNKIAILVPCHRIIGADQSLVGYAWGKARKRWLLQHEFRLALGVQTLF
jgi:methylated-DNA-[protein]-cysteine S-methyltransferase